MICDLVNLWEIKADGHVADAKAQVGGNRNAIFSCHGNDRASIVCHNVVALRDFKDGERS
jgi:hypothetical protein